MKTTKYQWRDYYVLIFGLTFTVSSVMTVQAVCCMCS